VLELIEYYVQHKGAFVAPWAVVSKDVAFNWIKKMDFAYLGKSMQT
jgi:hypothetical protein